MSFSSSSSTTTASITLKKFESQSEVDEKKKRRQEEWEEKRKPDDPIECPEAPVDNRCLYDKLEEQRVKKQEEFEEKVAFKNQVKRLDDDETEFLDFVTERQHEIKKARNQEEADIISELKDAQTVTIPVSESKSEDNKSKAVTAQRSTSKRSQMALLAGAVKRKGSDEASTSKKAKTDAVVSPVTTATQSTSDLGSEDTKPASKESRTSSNAASSNVTSPRKNQVAKVIGVLPSVLPGLTHYEDSSDSMSSSSDSEPEFSLSGRNNINQLIRQHAAQIQQQNH